jgi:hypothetical protein
MASLGGVSYVLNSPSERVRTGAQKFELLRKLDCSSNLPLDLNHTVATLLVFRHTTLQLKKQHRRLPLEEGLLAQTDPTLTEHRRTLIIHVYANALPAMFPPQILQRPALIPGKPELDD